MRQYETMKMSQFCLKRNKKQQKRITDSIMSLCYRSRVLVGRRGNATTSIVKH